MGARAPFLNSLSKRCGHSACWGFASRIEVDGDFADALPVFVGKLGDSFVPCFDDGINRFFVFGRRF